MDTERMIDGGARPDPAERRRIARPEGEEVTLSDGRSWLLGRPGLAPVLTPIRDRLFDHSVAASKVRISDILQVAWVCLLANYNLSDDEPTGLLTGLTEEQEQALTTAVMDALFGSTRRNHTYTEWALSAFYANGIDPAKVPASAVPDVLDQLEMMGRTAPQDKFISSVVAMKKRAEIFGSFERQGIKASNPE